MARAFVLNHSPCITCEGNNGRCSLDDTGEKYNALTCDLLTTWVMKPPLGRPAGSTNKIENNEMNCSQLGLIN